MLRLATRPTFVRRHAYPRTFRRNFSTRPGGSISFADILNSLDTPASSTTSKSAPRTSASASPKQLDFLSKDEDGIDDLLSSFDDDTKDNNGDFGAKTTSFGNRTNKFGDVGGSNYGNRPIFTPRNNSDNSFGGGGSGWGAPRDNYGGGGGSGWGAPRNNYGGAPGNSYGGGNNNFGDNSFSFGTPATWTPEDLKKTQKDCYNEHPEVKNLTAEQKRDFLKQHTITVSGNPPNPILSFAHAPVPPSIASYFEKFEKPTPIQSLGWPIAMKGLDMVGASQTGSGKTIGFIIPAITHILAQLSHTPHKYPDGPHALVLAPTRELAVQIAGEARPLLAKLGLHLALLYGGDQKYSQSQQFRSSPHLVVATPGRLIDFLNTGMTNLTKTTFVVIDEADRMLDMGFEPQLKDIMSRIRPKPHRQVLMWSATWPREVRTLADEFLHQAILVQVGSTELAANPNVRQIVHIVPSLTKLNRIGQLLQQIMEPRAKVLIFISKKDLVDHVAFTLQRFRNDVGSIHGGKDQSLRTQVLAAFRSGRINILVATEVAARGLDISDITHVVNYDMPADIESYIHRIGRTGRAGKSGIAHSFFSPEEDGRVLRDLIKVMRDANQEVPDEILELQHRTPTYNSGNNNNRRNNRY